MENSRLTPRHDQTPTSSSGASTPNGSGSGSGSGHPLSTSWTFPQPISSAVGGLLRRFSSEPSHNDRAPQTRSPFSPTFGPGTLNEGPDGVYTPPYRTASPYQPPPLYPVHLRGYLGDTPESAKLLTRALAEEIRLLVPPRLQLCEEWNLVYSLEEDGVSLGTLYKKCDDLRGLRNGFVLVVRDGDRGLFGAYLTEAPHLSPHYFGTGECFLWRASIISPSLHNIASTLPPPPSVDTTNVTRTTTLSAPPQSLSSLSPPIKSPSIANGASTPERIRFKAFPYSGINDYIMHCETGFFSIGGGDGYYGLWLDDNFEKGISSTCPTFGNEPLSDEGMKFDVVGVELWSIGT